MLLKIRRWLECKRNGHWWTTFAVGVTAHPGIVEYTQRCMCCGKTRKELVREH